MSKYQINKIQQVMAFNAEETANLINLMDATGDYPDWSEASDKQLRNHFNMVLAGL
jgi:hypothetical protein